MHYSEGNVFMHTDSKRGLGQSPNGGLGGQCPPTAKPSNKRIKSIVGLRSRCNYCARFMCMLHLSKFWMCIHTSTCISMILKHFFLLMEIFFVSLNFCVQHVLQFVSESVRVACHLTLPQKYIYFLIITSEMRELKSWKHVFIYPININHKKITEFVV